MDEVPRPIVTGRRIAALLLVVTTAAVLVAIISYVAWSYTRPPSVQ
ncbi:hypothetical protein [Frankia sp. AgKG'84/4]|nr:hypothetical protein [Frankia sp. AgKG'84/4]MCL9793082.1 hypothetical protein [Frankia sp. AgKG'84/4]